MIILALLIALVLMFTALIDMKEPSRISIGYGLILDFVTSLRSRMIIIMYTPRYLEARIIIVNYHK